MRKYLDLSTWIILFALMPFSILALLSQNSVPGDLFYPVKRGLENMILVASSVSPSTKVAFRTNLTEQRFKEAEQLLVLQGKTTALADFVVDVQIVEEELLKLSSFEDKKELSEKLVAKIDEYQTKLAQVQTQIEQQPAQEQFQKPSQPQQPIPIPIQVPTQQAPTPSGFQAPQPKADQPGAETPTPIETPKPFIQIPFQPQQTPTSIPILDSVKKEEVVTKVEETKEKLKEIKERVRKEREDAEVREKIREEQEKLKEQIKRQKEESREGQNEQTPKPTHQ